MINPVLNEDFCAIAQDLSGVEFEANSHILITGCTGFIGGYFLRFLIYLNSVSNLNLFIHCLVRVPNTLLHQLKIENFSTEELNIYECDLTSPIQISEKISYIFHFASIASPKYFSSDPIGVTIPNTVGLFNLLEFAKHNPISRFVYLSTTGVTGFIEDRLRPSSEKLFGPLDCASLSNCYLESKRIGEMQCLAWNSQAGVPTLIVRPSITYGPGVKLDDGRSYADFIDCILKKRDIELTSDGAAIRNFCYISDFISGLFILLDRGVSGEAYNIAGENGISIRDLAFHLSNDIFTDLQLSVKFISSEAKAYSRVNFTNTTASVSKIMALGWSQKVSLSSGFQRTVRYYQTLDV